MPHGTRGGKLTFLYLADEIKIAKVDSIEASVRMTAGLVQLYLATHINHYQYLSH